ncbi:MAG: hypothetical protein H6905_08380 [Hyphomicrobiales bacterium]|nr:hypothetical protein [Hyphomicrobiales bacterium]
MTRKFAPTDDTTLREAIEIADAYLDALADLRLSPLEVRDEKDLPFPKPEIQDALLTLIAYGGHARHSVANIEAWLVELAQFQPDVGEPVCDVAAEIARRISDAVESRSPIDAAALTQEIELECLQKQWIPRGARFRLTVEQDRSILLGYLG